MGKYPLELIKKVLEEVREHNYKGIEAIASRHNLSSGAPLVRWWIKRYNNCIEAEITNEHAKRTRIKAMQDNKWETRLMALERAINEQKSTIDGLKKDNKELKDTIKKEMNAKNTAQRELKKVKRELEGSQHREEVLKKSMPSCLVIEMAEKKTSKIYLYEAYWKIFLLTSKKGWSIKEACTALQVGSRDKYYQYLKRNNLPLPHQYNKDENYIKPQYQSRIISKARDYVDEYFKEHPNTTGSASDILLFIKEKYASSENPVHISLRAIRKIVGLEPKRFPCVIRTKKSRTDKANVREDLILNNYEALEQCEVIGMDGTWMDLIIAGKPVKILCEVAYDWFSRNIISYTFGKSENTTTVLETFKGIISYAKKRESRAIVQMDRGAANCSYAMLEMELEQPWVTISMSKAGFKHNSPTESLNGWLKDNFFCANGQKFKSMHEFFTIFNSFVLSNNKKHMRKYLQEKNLYATSI